MTSRRDFQSARTLDENLAQHIGDALRRDIDARGNAALAVSGGSTPKGLFAQLSQQQLDWSRVTVTLVDERWVNNDSTDSNEKLVRDHLLQHHAAAALWIGLKTEHSDAKQGLPAVQLRLAQDLPWPLTIVVLGMGGDGHTASWFPRAQNLTSLIDPDNPEQVATTDPVTAPHQRITLTLSAVLNSHEIILHIVGSEKREVFESATKAAYPVAAILNQTTTPVTTWWAPE
ncbi:MAG: 6-phosphogluconolactonase [Halioglobus sp.]